jgi:hypothetical protein
MEVEFDLVDGQPGRVLERDPAVLRPEQRATAMRGDEGHVRALSIFVGVTNEGRWIKPMLVL